MRLNLLTEPELLYVARNMRESDAREIFCTRFDQTSESLVRELLLLGGHFGWIASLDSPVAAIGAVPCAPGHWSVWMFATPEIHKIAKEFTAFVKRGMIPALLDVGCRRAECRSIVGHVEAHRWLQLLGAHRECLVPRLGVNGEDFIQFAWLPDERFKDRYVRAKLSCNGHATV